MPPFYPLRIVFFLTCLVTVLWGLFRPETPPSVFVQSDKWMHLLAFGGLSLSAYWAFSRQNAWLLWGALFAFAASAEFFQSWLQHSRYFTLEDMLANLLGVLIIWLYITAIKNLNS